MKQAKNVNEGIVRERLDKILNTMDVCKCKRCYLDMMSMALNLIPQRYATTDHGKVMIEYNASNKAEQNELDNACRKAIEIVSKNPRH